MQHRHSTVSPVLLQEDDAGDLVALEAACFSTPWTEEQYRTLLCRNRPPEDAARDASLSMPVFGVRAPDGELAAYISLAVSPAIQELEIYNIAVREAYRRQGIAKALLLHALAKARECGVARALLEVRPSNTAALALYKGTGFSLCGKRKKYYPDTGEDALILACTL